MGASSAIGLSFGKRSCGLGRQAAASAEKSSKHYHSEAVPRDKPVET